MPKGASAIAGASVRAISRPDISLSAQECREEGLSEEWNDQWCNWDDLGGDDPGWGDISS